MQFQDWWQRTRSSFWFVPLLCLAAAFLLAQGMVALDRLLPDDLSSPWFQWIYGVGIDGSRSMLSAIGTSMLAVAATSFSITISVVVTASSTYGPRLVGNFMSDRGNQTVLGVFAATFLYSLLVLRTIVTEDEQNGLPSFVPHLAVNLAVLIAAGNAVVLVWFIHHIATSVRVETLAHGVRENFHAAVKRTHPEETPEGIVHTSALQMGGSIVEADTVGFITDVDFDGLCDVAADHDAVVEFLPRVGDHILPREPLVRVWPAACAEDIASAVRRRIRIGDSRSAFQDVRYAEQQVLELAVRALSPGTNDPYTAVNAIQEVAAGITLAVAHPTPGNTMVRNDTVRVRYSIVDINEIVDMPFDQIRPYALDHVMVLTALIDLGARIESASVHDHLPSRIRRNIEIMMDDFRASGPNPHDLKQVGEHLERRSADLQQSEMPGGAPAQAAASGSTEVRPPGGRA